MPSSGVQTCALRSEEHTSELQSHDNLVCPLILEKKTLRCPRPLSRNFHRSLPWHATSFGFVPRRPSHVPPTELVFSAFFLSHPRPPHVPPFPPPDALRP